MRVIYKFPLTLRRMSIQLPQAAIIRHFGYQSQSHPFIWVELDHMHEKVKRTFRIFATGEDVTGDYEWRGTTQVEEFVWHLYEKK